MCPLTFPPPHNKLFSRPGGIFSGGDESGEGQARSLIVKSRPRSSEDNRFGGEGHSGGDTNNEVFLYDGEGVGDGLTT